MNPDSDIASEDAMNVVQGLYDLGQSFDEIGELINGLGEEYRDAYYELLDIKTSLESPTVANTYVDYKKGWYQDLKGNLYQYDGVVWDVVPGRETGELEFLG